MLHIKMTIIFFYSLSRKITQIIIWNLITVFQFLFLNGWTFSTAFVVLHSISSSKWRQQQAVNTRRGSETKINSWRTHSPYVILRDLEWILKTLWTESEFRVVFHYFLCDCWEAASCCWRGVKCSFFER